MTEYSPVPEVHSRLAFSLPSEVQQGRDARGLRRAVTRPLDYDFETQFEYRDCRLKDWSLPGVPAPDLLTMGFESIDLAADERLQALFAKLRSKGEITREQAREVRRRLTGRVFPLSGGKCLKLLHVAAEGLIMRKGGPNGLKPNPDATMSEMNDHDVAMAVHGDQDVFGTPLKQIMRGFAPRLFRHQTPDSHNRLSPLVLVNLWVPLQQLTRPLTLMDRRTLNGPEHQVQYALPTDTFLDRSEATRFNDIWTFLHDDAQQWYFNASMNHSQAYIFDTLGEPHGSFVVPGEPVAEYYYKVLQSQLAQLAAGAVVEPGTEGRVEEGRGAAPTLAEDTPAPLRKAIDNMATLAANAPRDNTQSAVADWVARAETAMDAVVRKSLEMRVVAVLLPDVWPFNRRKMA